LVTLARLKPRAGEQFEASGRVRVIEQGFAVAEKVFRALDEGSAKSKS